MFEKIIENRNKILIFFAILLLFVVSLWSFFGNNLSFQNQNTNNQQTADNPQLAPLPENNIGIAQDNESPELPEVETNITSKLEQTPKINTTEIAENLILNQQPEYTDLNSNLDSNVLIVSPQVTEPRFDSDQNPVIVEKTILPDLGDVENKSVYFFIKDEKRDYINLAMVYNYLKAIKSTTELSM